MKRVMNLKLALVLVSCLVVSSARAATLDANPSNYRTLLPTLRPGDTLNLAAGNYTANLPVSGLNGNAGAWITIRGPASNPPAIFLADASHNTVQIDQSSFVAFRNLTLDGGAWPAPTGSRPAAAPTRPPTTS